MKTTKIGGAYRLRADEGKWLTDYNDDMDIITYSSTLSVLTTKTRVASWREITDAENSAYLERKAIAEASMVEDESDEAVEP